MRRRAESQVGQGAADKVATRWPSLRAAPSGPGKVERTQLHPEPQAVKCVEVNTRTVVRPTAVRTLTVTWWTMKC